MPKTEANCHPSVWRRVVAIRARRINSKNRLGDLVKSRDAIKEDLRQIGKSHTPERTRLCEQFWDTLSAIEYERTRIVSLADLQEQAIGDGIQGKLFESDEDLDEEPDAVPEAPLYDGAHDDSTVGEPSPKPPKGAAPPPSGGVVLGESAAGLKLDSIGLGEKSVNALRDVGMITLGDVAKWKRENYGNCRLTKIGVDGKDELKLEQALRDRLLDDEGKPPAEEPKKRGRPPKAKA